MNVLKIIGGIALVMLVGAFLVASYAPTLLAAHSDPYNTRKCNVQSTQNAEVGDDISSTIVSAFSNRAWTRLELVTDTAGNATSTVFLNFNDGSAATTGSHVTLSTSTPTITFGLNTDFPYVGDVTGITNGLASTTVRVIDCRY